MVNAKFFIFIEGVRPKKYCLIYVILRLIKKRKKYHLIILNQIKIDHNESEIYHR